MKHNETSCDEQTYVTLYVRVWIETSQKTEIPSVAPVTLYVRVWIETNLAKLYKTPKTVTLYVRVWIETSGNASSLNMVGSPST